MWYLMSASASHCLQGAFIIVHFLIRDILLLKRGHNQRKFLANLMGLDMTYKSQTKSLMFRVIQAQIYFNSSILNIGALFCSSKHI